MQGRVDKFSVTLKKLASTIAFAFGTAAIINFGKESVKAASELSNAWIGLESIVAGQGKSFNKAKAFINDYISDGLIPLKDAVTSYKNLAARGYSTEQIEKTMVAFKDAAAFGRQSTYTMGEAVATATEGLKNENSILVDNAGVTKNVAKMWDDYAKSIGTTANRLTKEQKIQAEVNGILEETKFQTRDAAKLVNTYSGQVAMLSYNFQQLKVAVGNAIMPIVQAVLPGINAIISALVKLANVFAKVTALLFGKKPSSVSASSGQVKEQEDIASSGLAAADATDKLADATAGAGEASKKAAKDMKGVLANFDELNILADSAAGSVGGAAGGIGDIAAGEIPDLGDMDGGAVEEMGEKFKSLGEIFRDTLDEMLTGIPKLREAFLNFADSFNDFNQKLYDAFKFPGVLERVEELGRELAKAFNDLVNAIDWELWGRTLGAGLNLGLQFLTEFIYTFDWVNLGKKLAEFINGLVYEVDWYDFGRLLWAQFKISLETFAGFFTGQDMPALAKAASDTIMGFFDEMKATIERIDWGEIGRQIAEFLNNIDWIGVITSIAGALESMVEAGLELIAGFISNADTGTLIAAALLLGSKLLALILSKVITPIAKQIGSDLIKKISEAITSGGLGSLVSSISSAISGIAKAFAGISAVIGGVVLAASNFFDMWNNGFSLAKEAVMLVGIALAAVGAALLGVPATVAAIVAGIVAVVATAAVLIHEHWDEIKEAALNAWEAIKEAWHAAGEWFSEHVVEPVKEFFVDLWEGISTLAANAWEAVKNAWNAASSWFSETVITPVKEFFKKLWEDIKKLASDAWAGISKVWETVSGWFDKNVIQPVTKFFKDMWDGIKKKAGDIWEDIKKVWEGAKGWFEEHVTGPLGDAFSAVVDKIKEAVNGAIGKVEGLINAVVKAVNWLIDQLNKIHFDVPDWVPGVGGKSFGFNISHAQEVKLPRLAQGAVIPPNQQFTAVLGDQRSGKNLEAPSGLIRQMVAEGVTDAIRSTGGLGNGSNVTVIMEIDGREFGRASYKYGTAEQQRVGVRLAGVKS